MLVLLGMIVGIGFVLGVIGFYLAFRNEIRNDENGKTPTPAEVTNTAPTPYKDLIRLHSPQEGDRVRSPLMIRGEARGSWFFEATFPVVLTDWDGLIIAEGYATADGEWMTTEYVPFTAELTFVKPDYGERGSLILQKNNPSGLPEHDDAFEITVYFE